jgi:hypothetical protein
MEMEMREQRDGRKKKKRKRGKRMGKKKGRILSPQETKYLIMINNNVSSHI